MSIEATNDLYMHGKGYKRRSRRKDLSIVAGMQCLSLIKDIKDKAHMKNMWDFVSNKFTKVGKVHMYNVKSPLIPFNLEPIIYNVSYQKF